MGVCVWGGDTVCTTPPPSWSGRCIPLLNPMLPPRAPAGTRLWAPQLAPSLSSSLEACLFSRPHLSWWPHAAAGTKHLLLAAGQLEPLSEVPWSRCPLPVHLPSPRSPEHLPGKVRGSERGRMKLPKSSENMLKALSMGASWAGRARVAEEDEEDEEEEEEEWKLLSALKVEEVLWLIHGWEPGPGQAGRGG